MFTAVGKVYNGLTIDVFYISDENGKVYKCGYEAFIKRAENGQIKGVDIAEYNGVKEILFNAGLDTIKSVDEKECITVISKELDDETKNTIMYTIRQSSGKVLTLSSNELFKEAINGKVVNMYATVYAGVKALKMKDGFDKDSISIVEK